MSVYKKLQQARLNVVNTTLKKSGRNTYARYEYFELGDFIPTVHKVFNDVGLCGVFTLTESTAYLSVHETEGDGMVQFSTPLVSAEGEKQQAIQLLGSTHTYMRRYLWLMALELVEHDGVDVLPPVVKKVEEVKPVVAKILEKKEDVLVKEVEKVNAEVEKELALQHSEIEPIGSEDVIVKLHEIMVTFGASCADLKELSSFWKTNQKEIDNMKVKRPDLFKDLLAKFAEYKSKFKE